MQKKTFSVENTGNDLIEYGVFLENVINELKYYDDLIFTITCTSESLDNSVIPTPNSCSGVTDYQFPLTNEEILTNTIEAKVKHNYVLELEYIDDGDQSDDMGKEIAGKLQIYALDDVVNLIINGSNLESSDVLELHSEVKTSRQSNGKYKFVGVLPGEHELKLIRNGEVVANQNIKIINGSSETFDSGLNEISILNTTMNVNIEMSAISNSSIIFSDVTFDNITSTLAYKIKDSASKVTNGTKFVETAPSQIGDSPSENWENGLEKLKTYDVFSWQELIKIDELYMFYISKTDYDSGILDNLDMWAIYYGDVSKPDSLKIYNTSTDTCEKLKDSYFLFYVGSGMGDYYLPTSNYFKSGDAFQQEYYVSDCVDGIPSDGTKTKEEVILSKTEDDYGISYYYRGNVIDNYVTFANKCWRILRINGNETIKIILVDNDEVCSSNMDGSVISSISSYNTVDSESEIPTLNTVAFSNYQSNYLEDYISYLSPGGWCSESSQIPITNLKCNGKLLSDYTIGGKMYVGTVTEKELLFSGFYRGSFGKSFISQNRRSGSIGVMSYSGFQFDGLNKYYPNVIYYDLDNTNIWTTYLDVYLTNPTINLKKDIMVLSGDGTINNSYVIN